MKTPAYLSPIRGLRASPSLPLRVKVVASALAGAGVLALASASCSSIASNSAEACESDDSSGPCDGTFTCTNGGITISCPKTSVCARSPGSIRCVDSPGCKSPRAAASMCGGNARCTGTASTGITVECQAGAAGGPGGGSPYPPDPDEPSCAGREADSELLFRNVQGGGLSAIVGMTDTSLILDVIGNGKGLMISAKSGGQPTLLLAPRPGVWPLSVAVTSGTTAYTVDEGDVDAGTTKKKMVIVELDLPAGAPREVASITGSESQTRMLGVHEGEVILDGSVSWPVDGGVERALYAFSPTTKTLRRLLVISYQDKLLGLRKGVVWFATPVGVRLVALATPDAPREIAMDVARFRPERLSLLEKLYITDVVGTWYEVDETLQSYTPKNSDPGNANGAWDPASAVVGDTLYATQERPGTASRKVKAVPLSGGPARLYTCYGAAVIRPATNLVADATHVYFPSLGGLYRRAH